VEGFFIAEKMPLVQRHFFMPEPLESFHEK